MVWACFVGDKLGPIVFVDSSIMKEVYINMLADTLLPFIDVLHAHGQASIVFQQNNATPHSSPVTRKWLEDEAKKTQIFNHALAVQFARFESDGTSLVTHQTRAPSSIPRYMAT